MTADERPSGALDVSTLGVLGRRASSHRLAEGWAFRPDSMSPRRLEVRLDADQYSGRVSNARLDVHWFDGGDYTFHYLESGGADVWQCRWDRHPKPAEPRAHFHPPPDAAPEVTESGIEETHHLGALFAVLEWVEGRVETLLTG